MIHALFLSMTACIFVIDGPKDPIHGDADTDADTDADVDADTDADTDTDTSDTSVADTSDTGAP